jgi:hypothetical protein
MQAVQAPLLTPTATGMLGHRRRPQPDRHPSSFSDRIKNKGECSSSAKGYQRSCMVSLLTAVVFRRLMKSLQNKIRCILRSGHTLTIRSLLPLHVACQELALPNPVSDHPFFGRAGLTTPVFCRGGTNNMEGSLPSIGSVRQVRFPQNTSTGASDSFQIELIACTS